MTPPPSTPVFLIGPPGVGKTELGARACTALGWSFGAFDTIESARAGHLLEVAWETALLPRMIERLRKAGTTVALWDQPAKMQARASRPYVLRPSTNIITPGSYGRRGTTCVEFRRLDRGCDVVLLIDEFSLEEAAKELSEVLVDAVADDAEQLEALADHFFDLWREDTSAPKPAARALASAMAEFVVAREAAGASERATRGLESDLHVGGMLYFMYAGRRPTPEGVLTIFAGDAATDGGLFARKINDRPAAITRYRRTLGAFAEFLRSRSPT